LGSVPPPPNRTGGSPAYSSPVGCFTSKRIDTPAHGRFSSYTALALQRENQTTDEEPLSALISSYHTDVDLPPPRGFTCLTVVVLPQGVGVIIGRTEREHGKADLGRTVLEHPVGDLVDRPIAPRRGDDPEAAFRGATPQLHGMAGPFRGRELDFRSPTRRECLEPLPSSPPAGRRVEDHTDRRRSVRRQRGGQWPFPRIDARPRRIAHPRLEGAQLNLSCRLRPLPKIAS